MNNFSWQDIKDRFLTIDYHFYKNNPKRSLSLDLVRGVAIILMIIFHFCFDLSHFRFIDIDIYNQDGYTWRNFRYLILTLFLLCVGISLQITNNKAINKGAVKKRFITLIFFSILITLSSFIFFPQTWIYFGVIHFIAIASLLGLLFINRPLLALAVGGINLALYNLEIISHNWMFAPISQYLPSRTEDLVPITPWFSLVLFGMALGYYKLYSFKVPLNPITSFIGYLGRHSLAIYIIHQPILFGLVMAAYHIGK